MSHVAGLAERTNDLMDESPSSNEMALVEQKNGPELEKVVEDSAINKESLTRTDYSLDGTKDRGVRVRLLSSKEQVQDALDSLKNIADKCRPSKLYNPLNSLLKSTFKIVGYTFHTACAVGGGVGTYYIITGQLPLQFMLTTTSAMSIGYWGFDIQTGCFSGRNEATNAPNQ